MSRNEAPNKRRWNVALVVFLASLGLGKMAEAQAIHRGHGEQTEAQIAAHAVAECRLPAGQVSDEELRASSVCWDAHGMEGLHPSIPIEREMARRGRESRAECVIIMRTPRKRRENEYYGVDLSHCKTQYPELVRD